MLDRGNLFRTPPPTGESESFTALASRPGARLERIVSRGQASPPGFWYDQADDEWVALLAGAARLEVEGEAAPLDLAPGDWVHLPAHRRHRVASTAPDAETIWLALHLAPADAGAFAARPIGRVRSPYRDTAEVPKGCGAQHQAEGTIELAAEFEPALTDIEGFSHLYVLWVFDRAEGFDLLAQPPTADRPHGLFTTRSPRRPNPIGLTVVELLGREGATLRVRGVDMLDGTPVLDLKPYLSSVAPEKLRRGWLAEAEARRAAESG